MNLKTRGALSKRRHRFVRFRQDQLIQQLQVSLPNYEYPLRHTWIMKLCNLHDTTQNWQETRSCVSHTQPLQIYNHGRSHDAMAVLLLVRCRVGSTSRCLSHPNDIIDQAFLSKSLIQRQGIGAARALNVDDITVKITTIRSQNGARHVLQNEFWRPVGFQNVVYIVVESPLNHLTKACLGLIHFVMAISQEVH